MRVSLTAYIFLTFSLFTISCASLKSNTSNANVRGLASTSIGFDGFITKYDNLILDLNDEYGFGELDIVLSGKAAKKIWQHASDSAGVIITGGKVRGSEGLLLSFKNWNCFKFEKIKEISDKLRYFKDRISPSWDGKYLCHKPLFSD